MGIYSSNRIGLGSYSGENIIADESYNGVLGCYNALIDMERNNRVIFEEVIKNDLLDAYYLNEGYIEVIHEGAIENAFSRIKEFLKKIWEKIKGIFNTFIRKLDTVIIRDNKKFVDKYQRQVRAKNLSKLKYKYCKPTGKLSVIRDAVDGDALGKEIDKLFNCIRPGNKNFDYINKCKDLINDGEYFDHICDLVLPEAKTDYQTMVKEIHEFCFETEDSEEGLDSSRLTDIILILQGDKTKSDVEKAQRTINKYFRDINKSLDRISKEMLNYKGSDDAIITLKNESVIIIDETSKKLRDKKARERQALRDDDMSYNMNYLYQGKNSEKQISKNIEDRQERERQMRVSNVVSIKAKEMRDVYLPMINTLQQAISQMESFHSRLVACFLNEHKFNITQARKVFSKAVSYNDKAKNESVYLDALEEAAEYEINEMFENYY